MHDSIQVLIPSSHSAGQQLRPSYPLCLPTLKPENSFQISSSSDTTSSSAAHPKQQTQTKTLAHIDETSPHDQFVTEGGRTVGPNETTVLAANTGAADAQHPRGELGKGAIVKG